MEGSREPYVWFVSRVCEEFGCTPSQARLEIEVLNPASYVSDIMLLRAYWRTWEYERTTPPEKQEMTPLLTLLTEMQFESMREQMAALEADADNE